jgi:peptidoglycan/xylan/chitin deacetylase (PgdA/CDA1 family)
VTCAVPSIILAQHCGAGASTALRSRGGCIKKRQNVRPYSTPINRRTFLAGSVAATLGAAASLGRGRAADLDGKALIAITLDLEMSRHYPKRGMMEWDYEKGNLDDDTKRYAVEAGRVAKERGGLIHYFCVGRVLEQPNVDWLKGLVASGHKLGNHTYDHVNVKAKTPAEAQFRFARAPWLVRGKRVDQIIRENIEATTTAMNERLGIAPDGFRTPGGFSNGLDDRPDLQKMLLELGVTWVSSKYPAHLRGKEKERPTPDVYASIVSTQAHAQPYVYPTGLVEVPMNPISDVTAFRSTFWKLDYFLQAIRAGVEWAIDNRATFDFLAHPSCLVVEDPHFETIKLICDLARKAADRATIVGLDAFAQRARARSGKA